MASKMESASSLSHWGHAMEHTYNGMVRQFLHVLRSTKDHNWYDLQDY